MRTRRSRRLQTHLVLPVLLHAVLASEALGRVALRRMGGQLRLIGMVDGRLVHPVFLDSVFTAVSAQIEVCVSNDSRIESGND